MGFKQAPEVQKIAEELIAEYYPDYLRLGIEFRYIFSEKPQKSKNREVAAKITLVSGQSAYLILGTDLPYTYSEDEETKLFVITVYDGAWNYVFKSPHQRKALIHHELMHSEAYEDETEQGETKLVMRLLEHDITSFREEVRLYGEWSEDIKDFKRAIAQGPQMAFEEIAQVPKGALMEMPPVPTGGKNGAKREPARVHIPLKDSRESIRQAMDRQQAEGGTP